MQAAGETVLIDKPVAGNMRLAGRIIDITQDVKGNIVAIGETIHIHSGVVVGGSVLLRGTNVILEGSVLGTTNIQGDTVTLNGTEQGDMNIQSQNYTQNGQSSGNAILSSPVMSFGEQASIGKNLRYWSSSEKKDLSSVVKGTVSFEANLETNDQPNNKNAATAAGIVAAILAAFTIYTLFSSALILGLLLFATHTFFRDTAKILMKKPGIHFLYGLLYFIVTPIIALIFLITVIGFPIALAIAFIYILSLMLAQVCTAMVFARWTELRYKKKWSNVTVFFVALGIFIALRVIHFIPILGWIITSVAVCLAFGSLMQAKYDRYMKVR